MNERHDISQWRESWPPEPGLFRLRLARKGWLVPARIIHDQENNLWQAVIDGTVYEPHVDPVMAEGVDRVWHYGLKTSEADYKWLMAMKDHYSAHDPSHPCLNPRSPMNPSLLKPLMP